MTSTTPTRRPLRVTKRVPPPGPHEPSDEELLALLDGALDPGQTQAIQNRLTLSPLSQARLEVLRAAVAEFDAET